MPVPILGVHFFKAESFPRKWKGVPRKSCSERRKRNNTSEIVLFRFTFWVVILDIFRHLLGTHEYFGNVAFLLIFVLILVVLSLLVPDSMQYAYTTAIDESL